MKRYKPEHPELFQYIETLLFDDKIVNVFLDDYGQCYVLQYYEPETKEMVMTTCGAYETDYVGCAEMLFEDPKNCELYKQTEEYTTTNNSLYRCEEEKQTYCTNCKYYFRAQDRDKRWLEQYGVPYPEMPKPYMHDQKDNEDI